MKRETPINAPGGIPIGVWIYIAAFMVVIAISIFLVWWHIASAPDNEAREQAAMVAMAGFIAMLVLGVAGTFVVRWLHRDHYEALKRAVPPPYTTTVAVEPAPPPTPPNDRRPGA